MPYTAPSSWNSARRTESTFPRPSHPQSHGQHTSEPSLRLAGGHHSPCSFSYIHRHRRSPTAHTPIPSPGGSGSQSQRTASRSLGSDDASASQASPYHTSSLVTGALTPTGSILSPPDSGRDLSDDKTCVGRGREELMPAELGVEIISLDRSISPPRQNGVVGEEQSASEVRFTTTDSSNKPEAVPNSGEFFRPALHASMKKPLNLPFRKGRNGKVPQWENPEDSIGAWIAKVGRDDCWEAKGPAREAFVKFAREITAYLELFGDRVPEPHIVTLSVSMMGRSKKAAVPIIWFVCGDKDSRHKARNLIKNTTILDNYPGFKTAEAVRDPGFNKPIQLIAGAHPFNDTHPSANTEAGGPEKTILSVQSEDVFGRRVFVKEYNDNWMLYRKATAGAVFQSHNRYLYLLPAHTFDKHCKPPCSGISVDIDDYEVDNLYDSEEDEEDGENEQDEDDVDNTSKGSITPPDARSETSSSDDETHLSDNNSYSGATESDATIYTIPEEIDGYFLYIDAPASPTAIDMDISQSHSLLTSSSLAEIGKLLWINKINDYSIIEITDPKLLKKLCTLRHNDPQSFYPRKVSYSGPKDVRIKTVTGSSGLLTGEMSGTPAYIQFPGSENFQEVWKVRLNGYLAEGDSGSCVIDEITGDLYGHIVAGSLDQAAATAYIIPSHRMFEHMKAELKWRLEEEPRLLSLEEDLPTTSTEALVWEAQAVFSPTASNRISQTSLVLSSTKNSQQLSCEKEAIESSRNCKIQKSGELKTSLRIIQPNGDGIVDGEGKEQVAVSKTVPLDSQPGHVRHFLQVERPSAVSVNSSWSQSPQPVDKMLTPTMAICLPPDSRRNSPLALATEIHNPSQRVVSKYSKVVSKYSPKLTSANGISPSRPSEVATQTPGHSVCEDEMDLSRKPQMVRKKSGELVRPALRVSKKRPLSLPGIPAFSKVVHFDSQLEYIRHFLQVDKPLAISAGSSPGKEYNSDVEFPFEIENPPSQSEAFEWKAELVNFPSDFDARKHLPVRLEQIFLLPHSKNLVGVVAVANLAFQKHVVARFTLDNWKTISEVTAEYDHEPHRQQSQDGYDRFNFNIKLEDQANLDTKSMFICIRYNVNGLEFWDNNWSRNYTVEFSKKRLKSKKQDNSDVGLYTERSLPRSRISTTSDSIPSFPSCIMFNSPQPYMPSNKVESPLQLIASLDDDIVTKARRNKPTTQSFATRYDFEASLRAAMQSGSAGQTRDRLLLKKTGGQLDSHSPQPQISRPEGDQACKELVGKYCFDGFSRPTFHACRDKNTNKSSQILSGH